MADALGCDLVYALVPRRPLRRMLEDQAFRRAEALVERVSESMEMEDQGVAVRELHRRMFDRRCAEPDRGERS
jgi:hypothetical protein